MCPVFCWCSFRSQGSCSGALILGYLPLLSLGLSAQLCLPSCIHWLRLSHGVWISYLCPVLYYLRWEEFSLTCTFYILKYSTGHPSIPCQCQIARRCEPLTYGVWVSCLCPVLLLLDVEFTGQSKFLLYALPRYPWLYVFNKSGNAFWRFTTNVFCYAFWVLDVINS